MNKTPSKSGLFRQGRFRHLLTKSASILAVLVFCASCGAKQHTEYRPVEDMDELLHYRIQTIGDKKYFGLVENHMDGSPEYEIERIACIYDTIYSIHSALQYMFVCEKDGMKTAIDCHGTPLWEGSSFSRFEKAGESFSCSSAGHQPLIAFIVDEGAMFAHYDGFYTDDNEHGGGDRHPLYYCYGPYQDFFAAENGFAYKENGKWGVVKKSAGSQYSGGLYRMAFTPICDPVYDGAIEVIDNRRGVFWLLKVGSSWTAVDEDGNPATLSQAYINNIFKIKKVGNSQYFDSTWGNRRIGNQVVGSAKVYPY